MKILFTALIGRNLEKHKKKGKMKTKGMDEGWRDEKKEGKV